MPAIRRFPVSFPVGLLAACLGAGCAAKVAPVAPPPASPPLTVTTSRPASLGPAVPIARDQIGELIGQAEEAFKQGEQAMRMGRLEAARAQFDLAIDKLLGGPGGARSDARLSAAFDRLLDRISALDLAALREGDGFTEARSEPAAIDELLRAAIFDPPAPPLLSTEELVAEDLARTLHDLPITTNAKVLSYVELFQGRLRSFMTEGLTRGMQYLPMIESVFRSEGIPLDLALVPLVESAFKSTALSRVSARGMWQFMQGTAGDYDLLQTWFIDERSDPEKATRAAAAYLKALAKMFDGDWNLALASYNGGPGRVQGAIKRAKTSDFWKLSATTRYLPRETREYVPMIQAAVIIGRNPARYGFEITPSAPLTYDQVTVPGALDLRILAEWAGVETEDIQRLNPELRRTTTPMGSHALKVPVGTAATIDARLAAADPSIFVTFRFHTVKRGESLTSIARKYNLKVADLRADNGLPANARVKANQTLRIPERTAAALPTSRPTAAVNASARPATYTVKRGDTLFSIARRFAMSVDDLKRLNQLSSDRIGIGDRLTVRR
jgi:membrane-bound lytic murein transglycosylase D